MAVGTSRIAPVEVGAWSVAMTPPCKTAHKLKAKLFTVVGRPGGKANVLFYRFVSFVNKIC